MGVCAALGPEDVITSTHRPHGHAIARGLSVDSHDGGAVRQGPPAAARARAAPCTWATCPRGWCPPWPSWAGRFPWPRASRCAFKMRTEKRVAVAFMGDGATNEGAFHEALNMAAIWDLPVVFVVENNLYGASTPVKMVVKTAHISDRAAAYGMPGVHHGRQRRAGRPRDRVPGGGAGPRRQGSDAAGAGDLSDHRPLAPGPVPLPAGGGAEAGAGQRAHRQVRASTCLGSRAAVQGDLDAVRESVKAEVEAAVQKAMADPEPAARGRAGGHVRMSGKRTGDRGGAARGHRGGDAAGRAGVLHRGGHRDPRRMGRGVHRDPGPGEGVRRSDGEHADLRGRADRARRWARP